jgi:hypothetical protein
MPARCRRSAGQGLLGFVVPAAASLAVLLRALPLAAQSAADLSTRLVIDGSTAEWNPAEAAFRNPDICHALQLDPCGSDEERPDDSVGSSLHDLRQIRVTWDANALYVAAEATLGGDALVVFLDWTPGGLTTANALGPWRRALRFGPEVQPEAFLAVADGQAVPELWRVTGSEQAVRVAPESYVAAASFAAEAAGRALEAAIPWTALFPQSGQAVNPAPGAPSVPMCILPPACSTHGLRITAAVVSAAGGLGALDVAPDNTGGVPLDNREVTLLDRAVFVDWDASREGPPHFVNFGAAIQSQAAGRFVPAPAPATGALRLENLRSFANGRPSRLLLPDRSISLAFAFDVGSPAPAQIYVTATVYSMRGDRVRELYRDAPRTAGEPSPTSGAYGVQEQDFWDGRDGAGQRVSAGVYVLRLQAGLAPGAAMSELRRAITVVD